MSLTNSTRLITLLLIVILGACTPDRWEHADVSLLGKDGQRIQTWENVSIKAMGPQPFSGGPAWIRFKQSDGKEISLIADYMIEYR